MIPNSLHKALVSLGLSDLAGNIYIYLLKNYNTTVLGLSKKFAVSRNLIYKALAEIAEAGLMQHKEQYSRHLEVVSPSRIASLLESKRFNDSQLYDSFISGLPTVLADLLQTGSLPQFKIYRTKEQIMTVMYQLYSETSEEICCLGNEDLIIELLGKSFLKEIIKQRMSKNRGARILVPHKTYFRDILKPQDTAELRSYRMLPVKSIIDADYHVMGERVFCVNPVIPMGYLIQDKLIATMFKQIFEMLWGLGEEL